MAIRLVLNYRRIVNFGLYWFVIGEGISVKKSKLIKVSIATTVITLMMIPAAFAQEASQQEFDHSIYAEVLRKYVVDGLVNYAGLKADPLGLDRYLVIVGALPKSDIEAYEKNKKIAFYINIYNARTLQGLRDNYPIKSIKNIPGDWDRLEFMVAGENLTLDYIEHKILRSQFKESRVNFALVCGALGCPQLRNSPYTASNLNAQLHDQGRRFINDTSRNRLDRGKNRLYLSSIFKWFKADFGDNVLVFISEYMRKRDVDFIRKNKTKIKYQYDWNLNELVL